MNLSPASAEREAEQLLEGWLGRTGLSVKHTSNDAGPDFTVRTRGATFVVEVKNTTAVGSLNHALQQVRAVASKVSRGAVPVVAVPFMTDMGRQLCAKAGVSWFDLSGNADIQGPGVRIYIEGKPNRFKRRGRPSTVFAPRSSRVVRALLTARSPISQHDLAELSGLDEGFTSRIVGKLIEDEFVERLPEGGVGVRDAAVLLDAWREQYSFEKHTVVKGHVTARSGDEALKMIGKMLRSKKIEHAATGLGAAWLLTKFAGFRLATFFLSREPDEKLRKAIGFRQDERGANVWLVVPIDDAVFVGAKEVEGIRCVHALQAYLDLKAHSERASEAAAELRKRLLSGKS